MLPNMLKKLRVKRGLTQQEMADALEIDRVTYTNYELGRRNPDLNMLKKIAGYFKVTTDYLLGTTNKPTHATAPELKEYGIEWIELSKEAAAIGLTPEDIREIIRIHHEIMDKRKL